jgi:hypothetical protein
VRRTRDNSLAVYWSKAERDLVLCHPSGPQTKADSHYLNACVITKEVSEELTRRGYDVTTLRFSICKAEGHARWEPPQEPTQ